MRTPCPPGVNAAGCRECRMTATSMGDTGKHQDLDTVWFVQSPMPPQGYVQRAFIWLRGVTRLGPEEGKAWTHWQPGHCFGARHPVGKF